MCKECHGLVIKRRTKQGHQNVLPHCRREYFLQPRIDNYKKLCDVNKGLETSAEAFSDSDFLKVLHPNSRPFVCISICSLDNRVAQH